MLLCLCIIPHSRTEFPPCPQVLYRAVTVFPATNLQSAKRDGVYTFQPGQHDFPFDFKVTPLLVSVCRYLPADVVL